MAAKDFSKISCPSCGMLGTLRKEGNFVVCQDHLCGRAFPITKSGAFLCDAKPSPPKPDKEDKAPPPEDPADPDNAPPEDPVKPKST